MIQKDNWLMRMIFSEPISKVYKIKTSLKEVKFKSRPPHPTMSNEIKNSKGSCLDKTEFKWIDHRMLKLKVKNHNSIQKPRNMQTNKFNFGRYHSE
jgi:hypothetical protein